VDAPPAPLKAMLGVPLTWHCASRAAVAADGSPEAPSLRWILVHLIEEYARHNGHADLLREAVDGQTGE
jgi:hypothetical protein